MARRSALYGLMVRAGGVAILVGALMPWGYVPVAGLWLGWPGVLGLGALVAAAGAILAFRRLTWLVSGPMALACAFVSIRAQADLPRVIKTALLGLQAQVEPMNGMLARFNQPPIILFNSGTRWADLRGPGPQIVLDGAALVLLGAVLQVYAAHTRDTARRCPACGHRHAYDRLAAFCVRCGTSLTGRRSCPDCHTIAHPGDAYCATCGTGLPAAG